MKNTIIFAWICFVYLKFHCKASENGITDLQEEPCQCQIDLNELAQLNKHPIYLNSKTNNVIYPGYEDSYFTLETGETMEVHCTRNGIMIGDEHLLARKLILTCMYKTKFKSVNLEFDIRTLRCVEAITSTTRLTKTNCGKQGQEIDVGYNLVDSRFILLYTVCFNFISQVPEFTRSKVHPTVTWQGHVKDIKKCNEEYYNLPRPVYVYYDSQGASHLFSRQTGRPDYTKWLITRSRKLVIEKFYMVPQTDMFFKYEKRATQYFINIVPHFMTIPWESIRMYLRLYALQNEVQLDIYTGTFLRMKLPHVETKYHVPIYLEHHMKKIPVPEIIYTVAYDRKNAAGIAIIGINNFMTKNAYHHLCIDISNRIPWMSDFLKKYVYVCKIREWFKVVNYAFPNFYCRRILGAQMTSNFENAESMDDQIFSSMPENYNYSYIDEMNATTPFYDNSTLNEIDFS